MLYREFATQEQIDREYNVAAAAHDAAGAMVRIRGLSARTLEDARARMRTVAYGPTRAERLLVLPAAGAPRRPVFVLSREQ